MRDHENDQLPQAQWGDVAPSTSEPIVQAQSPSYEEEIAQWAPTFEALGYGSDVRALLSAHANIQSRHDGKPILTYEALYRHLSVQTIPDTPQKQSKREVNKERASRVEQARTAWRKAVADRKSALAQWDAYVAHLHAEFVRARDERDPSE